MSIIKINEARTKAKILVKYLRGQGATLAYCQGLEAVARMEHFHDWATYLAAAKAEAALDRKYSEVQDWPLYVFYFYEGEDCAERLYHLPKGTPIRLASRWGEVDETGAVEVPEGFVLDARVVVTQVYSTVPAVDKYGLPWYADEDKAHAFFREEIGCATATPLEASFRDTGDDTASRYWFEARVDPAYAAQLNGEGEQPEAEEAAGRYVHGGWSHIFHANGPELHCRIAYDLRENRLIGMQIRRGAGWGNASRAELADVEDSLKNTNDEALDNPEAWGLDQGDTLPDWFDKNRWIP